MFQEIGGGELPSQLAVIKRSIERLNNIENSLRQGGNYEEVRLGGEACTELRLRLALGFLFIKQGAEREALLKEALDDLEMMMRKSYGGLTYATMGGTTVILFPADLGPAASLNEGLLAIYDKAPYNRKWIWDFSSCTSIRDNLFLTLIGWLNTLKRANSTASISWLNPKALIYPKLTESLGPRFELVKFGGWLFSRHLIAPSNGHDVSA